MSVELMMYFYTEMFKTLYSVCTVSNNEDKTWTSGFFYVYQIEER